ncbi:DUF805 domain-containing protein [Aurantiacibacter sp. D1-12]|uniref:DUF805 domain-containing protein n=1 Tax=Aurantiacibacter sp. D1-12 TaxID=2993658 RepID=UPI00237CFB98|nr:DUF805 domain-containing protein [Aurantiacibacter sp. D1-12]MDE1468426.1 DUF805 domain-containing protein [Aurantiacibacter sp. D1-12]
MAEAHRHDPFAPVVRVLKGSLNFKGRAQRTDGILYYFLVVLFVTVLQFASSMIGNDLIPVAAKLQAFEVLIMIIQLPLIAWFVRRLHDQGKSDWYLLIFPVAWAFSFLEDDWQILHAILMLGLVLSLVALIFWPPTQGPNRYGPDPRATPQST